VKFTGIDESGSDGGWTVIYPVFVSVPELPPGPVTVSVTVYVPAAT
jgi:hypothetical protein